MAIIRISRYNAGKLSKLPMWLEGWDGNEKLSDIRAFEARLVRIGELLGITLPLNKYFVRDGSSLIVVYRYHEGNHRSSIRLRMILSNGFSAVNVERDGLRVVVSSEVGEQIRCLSSDYMRIGSLIHEVILARDNSVYED